ncbi:hypothetical protein V5799_024903 [Amblyomma americanum]|uniref:Uncharacterized protein n=1 Tax=Amblyomma americanum TaxID=6943 RepID=A0AAQ4EAZ5_AMBAM
MRKTLYFRMPCVLHDGRSRPRLGTISASGTRKRSEQRHFGVPVQKKVEVVIEDARHTEKATEKATGESVRH